MYESNIYARQSYGSYRERNIRVKSVKCVLTFVKMGRVKKYTLGIEIKRRTLFRDKKRKMAKDS